MYLFFKRCAGPVRRLVRAGPCCRAGTLTGRRTAAFSLSMVAVEETGITLSQRSTACLCAAAASVSSENFKPTPDVLFTSSLSLTLVFPGCRWTFRAALWTIASSP